MKNILLPTDFSKNSINAINYAVKLFENTTCNFYLLNTQMAPSFVSDDMMVASSSVTVYNDLVEIAKESTSNIIVQLQKKYNNSKHSFHSIVDYDNFVDSVNQNCELYKIDLIIMGTNGASGLQEVFFGTNALHVIQKSKIPVLVIPDGCKFKALDKIAFASSMKTVYEPDYFESLFEIVNKNDSELRVLHVANHYNEDAYKIIKNVEFFYSHFKNVKFNNLNSSDGDVYKSIHDYAKKNKTRLVAILSKTHSFLERLFIKHNVDVFAFKIDIPLLVMHDTEK